MQYVAKCFNSIEQKEDAKAARAASLRSRCSSSRPVILKFRDIYRCLKRKKHSWEALAVFHLSAPGTEHAARRELEEFGGTYDASFAWRFDRRLSGGVDSAFTAWKADEGIVDSPRRIGGRRPSV